jgi:hypothetical protein
MPRRTRRVRVAEPAPLDVGPIVRWRQVSRVVRVLGATAVDDTALGALGRLTFGLTAPLVQLEELGTRAEQAIAGDAHACREVRDTIARLAANAPGFRGIVDRLLAESKERCCGANAWPSGPDGEAAPGRPRPDTAQSLLDESALAKLLTAVARLYVEDADTQRQDAIDTVVALAAAATHLGTFVRVLNESGAAALVDHLDDLAAAGRLAWVGGAPLPVRSGGAPGGPFGPEGIPGLPGGFSIPHGDPDNPLRDPRIDDLLGRVRHRRRWDPEIWDHNFPWWRDPIEYIDQAQISLIRCLLVLAKLLQQRKEPPPVPPPKVVWADTITRVRQEGACPGDFIVIFGSGFGATQPSNIAVLLPALGGCRPVAVSPPNWSDTRIRVRLPPWVKSGPVGFGDADYIALYDDWAKRMNALTAQIRALPCFKGTPPPRVLPFGMCPPTTNFNRLRAGTPVINAFTANFSLNAVVEPSQAITLRWTVLNAEQVQIDRISATGPTFSGSTSLVNPLSASYALGAPNHTGPVVFRYRLTATGPCGTLTRDLAIVGSKRPQLSIAAVEVTQSIQTLSQSVRLVASKPTVVRVFVNHGLAGWWTNQVPGVTGRLRVHRSGGTSSWFDPINGSNPMAATPGASITVIALPQRNTTNDSLNFLIPSAWATDTISLEIEVRVSGFGAAGAFAGFSQSFTMWISSYTFEKRRTLELRYIRVNWGGNTPTDAVCLDTLRTAVPLLATPTANISALAGVGVQTPGGTGDDDRDDLLDDFDDRHNCSFLEALFEWAGADCPDDDGAIWVLIPGVFYRGKAYDIPSNVCFTPPSNGPYAAHELSHCLNQVHVGVMCANGQQAQGGDAPSAWPNNAQLLDVPFDVTRNRALTLAGTGVFDVMTYCGTPNNTWPMPARWQRLWDRIGA